MQSFDIAKPDKTSDYRVVPGPSFSNGLPDLDEWLSFKKLILNPDSLAFAELWFNKATTAKGTPLRKDFSFHELVTYGSNLYMAKLTEDNRWHTTYCGNNIVDELGLDMTGKYLDEFADPETSVYWLDNSGLMTDKTSVYMEFCTLEFLDKEYRHCSMLNLLLKSGSRDFPDIMMVHEAFTNKSLAPELCE